MRAFAEFLNPMQKQLFKKLCKIYGYKTLVNKDNFILVSGSAPVMLVAHLNKVHIEPVKVICKSKNKNILMSPQRIGGDDKCISLDAVDCENFEFEKYITSKGFRTAYGSFSDISFVASELGIAAVNLSSG